MSLLRIVLGYRTEDYRNEQPQVLAVTRVAEEAQQAGEQAPADIHRVELIEKRGGKRIRKRTPIVNGEPVRDTSAGGTVIIHTPGLALSDEELAELLEKHSQLRLDHEALQTKLIAAQTERDSLQRRIDDDTAVRLEAAVKANSALANASPKPSEIQSPSGANETGETSSPVSEPAAGASVETVADDDGPSLIPDAAHTKRRKA